MIENLPVMDGHMHLDPKGTPVDAVNRFVESGGTHLIIVHKPYHHITEDSPKKFREGFETTISMCELARRNGVKAWCVLGPYPGGLPRLAREIGLEEATRLHLIALDTAFELVDDGAAIGIGEIGRVHFPAGNDIQKGCDQVLEEALKGAKVRNCPVILHTESYKQNDDLFVHLSSMADRTGLAREKMVKHFAGWEEGIPEIGMGISISMQARRKNMEKALESDLDFLLETDYIDDRSRPDVVMPPDTVPRKISWAYRRGFLDRDRHHRLMIELPERIFGVRIG